MIWPKERNGILRMRQPRHIALPAVLLLAILAVQGCAHSAPEAPADLDRASLGNLAYPGIPDDGAVVQLRDGQWKGPPPDPGSALLPAVDLAGDLIARGDLDGDAIPEAAVLIVSQPGGSGTFSYIAVVSGSSGMPRAIATALLGDRVQVRAIRIEDATVIVDMRGHGPDDPSCCPSLHLRQTWRLRGTALEEDTTARTSARTAISELDDTHWELARWSAEEPALPAPVVTLGIAGGRLSGHAGCNRFGAAVRDGASPGDLVVSLAMATRMACEENRMRTEARFLRLLPTVTGFRYDQGKLMLAYRRDDGGGAELWFRVGSAD